MKYNFNGLTGDIITPNDPSYDIDRQEWNRSIDKYPIAIVYCENKCDVRNAIAWTRKNNVCFRIRSGGHNYEGYSTGNDLLVIDISRLNRIKVLEDKKLLIIEAGVKNNDLYDAVSSLGYPFPGGSCPTVGVSGYTLGGGWGYSCRHLGMGIDSLIGIELVDYRGKIIIANEYYNTDLFWACRGAGGGNFGVVVGLTYRLPEKVDRVTMLDIYYPNCSKDKLVDIFEAVQNSLSNLDSRLTFRTGFYNSIEEGLASFTRGIFYGTPEEVMDIIKFFTEIEGCMVNTYYESFYEIVLRIQRGFPPYENFKSTGRFMDITLSRDEISGLMDSIMVRPVNSIFADISIYSMGGKISEVGKIDTAFYFRNSIGILGVQSIWLDNQYKDINVKWVQERVSDIYPLTVGSFVNFPYSELVDYEKEYYGMNKFKLRRVKKCYDPYNVFRYPQSIKL